MRLDNYEGGLRTLVRYWERLGNTSADGSDSSA
jgi:hypothetical protein